MKFYPCPESYIYSYFLCIHNIHYEDDNFHLQDILALSNGRNLKTDIIYQDTGQNTKIGIKKLNNPCILLDKFPNCMVL